MVFLGHEAQVKAHFGLFGDSVCVSPFGDSTNLYTRQEHDLRLMYHRIENHFEGT
jgi:hypothetical protein